MKKLLLLSSIICINILFSQKIGIKTSNPQGPFHLDTRGNNPATGGLPSLPQVFDDFMIDTDGSMNIGPHFGIGSARSKLYLFFATTGGDNVRIDGVLPAPNPEDIDLLGAIRPNPGYSYLKREQSINELDIPKSTMLALNTDVTNFLNGVSAGGAQEIPMTLTKNAIEGLTYNPTTHFVTLPAGTYQFTLIYAASHGGCTLSSYFYDFPLPSSFSRVHSTSDHLTGTGAGSRHTGTITYTSASLPAGKQILINLGRGVSGNCSGPGMTLFGNGTQFIITRIGD
ncbi:hypothetical protein ATE47_10000 [Chryseobacterium sp. IHB B 17019]|uniref:hypothetical protein n=1 Tax=Chryseobacterium sp. IHB B 17019 TaxID=1721091 RepID=UPI00071F075E|nr:hypothetical protein [Chryseobacterium sp. IHB B 17019]ALR30838.1 hypothetical protein ATE47_10000 [Chryseobacterium sp. IHB B 17019]